MLTDANKCQQRPLKWYYMHDQIVAPWFCGVSHRIPGKNKNAVYRLQISTLVPGVFEKCVKYANEIFTKLSNFLHSDWLIFIINKSTDG